VQVAAVHGGDAGLDPVVGRRQQPDPHPKAAVTSAVTSLRWPRPEPGGAVQVGGEVAVAEGEPRLVPEPLQLAGDGVGLLGPPPLLLGVDHPAEPVGDRVEVRADPQAEVVEVVADVDDRGDLGGVTARTSPRRNRAPPTPPASTTTPHVASSGTLPVPGW
jgi:hypothetical protein